MATQGIMQSSEIITEALQFGGNPALTIRAQNFLNMFLDHLYRSFDWRFLLTEVAIASSNPIYTFTVPADYGRVKAVHLDGTTADNSLVQVEYEFLWQRIRQDVVNGTTSTILPTYFAVEQATPKAYVYPIPVSAFTGKMLYFKIPPKLTFGASEYPLFPDSLALLNAVTNYVEAYERESLQVIIDREADQVLKQYANAHFDVGRSNAHDIQLDPAIFGGWNYRES